MDELTKAWMELNAENKSVGLTEQEILKTLNTPSSGVIEKLYRQVRIKFLFALCLSVLITISIPFVFPQTSQVLLAVLWMAFFVGTIFLYKEKQTLQKGIDMGRSVLEGITTYHNRVKKILRYEELVSLTLYPVSIVAGFLYGVNLVNSATRITDDPRVWFALFVLLIILTPLSHKLTRYLHKRTFGKYLDQLKQSLKEFESIN